MKKIYLIILSIFLSTAATAEEDIGKFWKAKKTTIDSKKAYKGTKIKLGQLIKTSNSGRAKAEIMTVDDSRYLIFKNTTIKFDRLEMDGKKCKGLRATLVSGKIRSTSGSCGDGKTEIKTSLGAAFAWGTDYDLVYIPEGEILEGYEDVAPGFYQKVNEGQVKVSNDAGSIMVNPGEASFISFNDMLAPSYIPTPKFFSKTEKIIGKPTEKLKKKLKEIQDREKQPKKKKAAKESEKPAKKKVVKDSKETKAKEKIKEPKEKEEIKDTKAKEEVDSKKPTKKKTKILFGLIEVDEDSAFAWMGSSEEEEDKKEKKKSGDLMVDRVVYYDPEEEEDQALTDPVEDEPVDQSDSESTDIFLKDIEDDINDETTPIEIDEPIDPVDPIEPEKTIISRSNVDYPVEIVEDLVSGKTTSTTPTYERIEYSDGTNEDILKYQSIEVLLLEVVIKYEDEFTKDGEDPEEMYRDIESDDETKKIKEYYKKYTDGIYKNGYKYSSKTKTSKVIDASGGIIERETIDIIYENQKDLDYEEEVHLRDVSREEFFYREVKTTTKTLGEWQDHGEIIVSEIEGTEIAAPDEYSFDRSVKTTKYHRSNSNKQPQKKEETTVVITEYLDEVGTEIEEKLRAIIKIETVGTQDRDLDTTFGEHLYTMQESKLDDIDPWENDGVPIRVGDTDGVETTGLMETTEGSTVTQTKYYYTDENIQNQTQLIKPYILTEKLDPNGDPMADFIPMKDYQTTENTTDTKQIAAAPSRGALKRVVLGGREDDIFGSPILTGNNIVVTGEHGERFSGGDELKVISESLYDDLFHTVNSAANGVDTIEIEVSIDDGPNVKYEITPTDKRSDYSSFLSTKYYKGAQDAGFDLLQEMKIGTPTINENGTLSGYNDNAEIITNAMGLDIESVEDEGEYQTINHGGSTIHYGVGQSKYEGKEDEYSAYIYEERSNDLNLSGDDMGMKLPKAGVVVYDLVPGAQSKILITSSDNGATVRDDDERFELNSVDLNINFGNSDVDVTVKIKDTSIGEDGRVFESNTVTTTLNRSKEIQEDATISGYFIGSQTTATNPSDVHESQTETLLKTTLSSKFRTKALQSEGDLSVSGVMMGNKGSHVGMGYSQAITIDNAVDVASGTALLQARTYDGISAPIQQETGESVVFTDLSSAQSSDNDSSWGWWKEETDRIDKELGTENPSLIGAIGTADSQTQNLYSDFISGMDSNEPMNLRKSGSIDYDIRSNTNLTINAANGSEVSDKYHLTGAGLNINFGNSDVDTTLTVSETDSSGQLINSITGNDSGFLNTITGKFEIDGGYMNEADALEHDISQGMFGARGKVLDDQGSNAGMEFKMAIEDIDANNPLNNNTVTGVILFKEKN